MEVEINKSNALPK